MLHDAQQLTGSQHNRQIDLHSRVGMGSMTQMETSAPKAIGNTYIVINVYIYTGFPFTLL